MAGDLSRHFQQDFTNFGIVGDWHVLRQTQLFQDTVCLGDRFEFRRAFGGYAHWGIYAGSRITKEWDYQVVHLGLFEKGATFCAKKLSGLTSLAPRCPETLISPIEEVLGNDKVRINNVRDLTWAPLKTDEIIAEATRWLDNQIDNPPTYHICRHNCEHFVNLCRYGRSESCQGDYLRSVPVVRTLLS